MRPIETAAPVQLQILVERCVSEERLELFRRLDAPRRFGCDDVRPAVKRRCRLCLPRPGTDDTRQRYRLNMPLPLRCKCKYEGSLFSPSGTTQRR